MQLYGVRRCGADGVDESWIGTSVEARNLCPLTLRFVHIHTAFTIAALAAFINFLGPAGLVVHFFLETNFPHFRPSSALIPQPSHKHRRARSHTERRLEERQQGVHEVPEDEPHPRYQQGIVRP